MAHTLPDLPYAYDALEPHIDRQTMELHHDKHHATYVNKLNDALASSPELAEKSVIDLLKDFNSIPESIQTAVKNHGGGHANHTLFWEIMRPAEGTSAENNTTAEPSGALLEAINKSFGDFTGFMKTFTEKATGVFGSGWAWLVADNSGQVQIVTTANQDSPYMQGLTPLMGIDVWEHAYYLKYQNRRPEYIENWVKLVNWDIVSANYENLH